MVQILWKLAFVLLAVDLFLAAMIGWKRGRHLGRTDLNIVSLLTVAVALAVLLFGWEFQHLAGEPVFSWNLPLALGMLGVATLTFKPCLVLEHACQLKQSLDLAGRSEAMWARSLPSALERAISLISVNVAIAGSVMVAHYVGWHVPVWAFIIGAVWCVGVLGNVLLLWMTCSDARFFLESVRHATPGSFYNNPNLTARILSWTPYDQAAAFGSELAGRSKPYDLFLSYKSENVAVVRHVADQLIANGLRVWFAEYCILLSDRDRFQDAIDAGIRQSARGVVFTNDHYASSPYCSREIEQLLEPNHCGPDKVVEIRIPEEPLTHGKWQALEHSPAMNFTGNVAEVLRFVQSTAAYDVEFVCPPEADEPKTVAFRAGDLGYSVDAAGWAMVEEGHDEAPGTHWGPRFERRLGHYQAGWNLVIGSPTVVNRTPIPRGDNVDDRALYEQAVAFAREYVSEAGAECKGVHLLFVGGYSHLGLTYWRNGLWLRKYSVVIPHPSTQVSTEFAFTWSFAGPFREFCRNAHLMDRVVSSFRLFQT